MTLGRKPKWTRDSKVNGVTTYTLSHWTYFHDFIQEKLIDNTNYVFRGQRNEKWELEPTLNRLFKNKSNRNYSKKVKEHLENFKYSIRGRADFVKDIINEENELWSVGQHNFLATPLLDFTNSPYVAAYFAFYEKSDESSYRVIYALSQSNVRKNSDLELYKPMSGHNPRLLNQGGLFVKFKNQNDIETMIKLYLEQHKEEDKMTKLFKIRISNDERAVCLKTLNKMNINHNSLFPDLFGASIYCNTRLDIDKY